MMKNDMGARLRELRESRKLTQEEVGKIIGVQKAAIQKYEKGYVKNLKRESIEKLSKFYGVSADYIMCLDEEHTKERKEVDELLEVLKNRPELTVLFNITKDATTEDIMKAIKIIETFLGK